MPKTHYYTKIRSLNRQRCQGAGHAELLLQTREDGPPGAHRQLLPDDLEQQRPESIHRWKLGQPGARIEVRMLVDEPRKHRICLA
jgi:hypothetical protein